MAQPASALWAIRFAMAYLPAIITLAGMAALLGYDLDERRLAETGDAALESGQP